MRNSKMHDLNIDSLVPCDHTCILVIISTYNGSDYFQIQFQSITSQQNVCTHLLIRDDGSNIEFVDELKRLRDSSKIELLIGENIGSNNSFLTLLYLASNTKFQYIAFSDQDDIWHPDKMENAMRIFEKNPSVGLYSCQRNTLGKVKKSICVDYSRNGIALPHWLFFENISFGNTQVLKNDFARNILDAIASNPVMLCDPIDFTIARYASLKSLLFVDKRKYIDYRIHDKNQIGLGKRISTVKEFLDIINNKLESLMRFAQFSTILNDNRDTQHYSTEVSHLHNLYESKKLRIFIKKYFFVRLRTNLCEDLAIKLAILFWFKKIQKKLQQISE